jgi:DNA polymerase III subunit beta
LMHRTMTSGSCQVYLYPGAMTLQVKGASIYSKLIEGNYPNWRQVMPSNDGKTVTVEREVLLAAVKRVGLMADDKSNSVTFAFSENQITISVNSPNIGEAIETVDCQCAISMKTAMNPHYVMQLLSGLRCDAVSISLLDEASPVVFSDESFLYVIMPMRVAN